MHRLKPRPIRGVTQRTLTFEFIMSQADARSRRREPVDEVDRSHVNERSRLLQRMQDTSNSDSKQVG